MQAPNWAAAAAVESAVLGECGTTAVHSRILEWHMVDAAAAGCTGHLMVVVLTREGWHMEGQNSWVHCTGMVLHDAEGGGGGAAAAVADGCSGSSGYCS